jgi:hypothetical protein
MPAIVGGENGQRLHEGKRVVAFTSNGKRTRKKDATVWPDYNNTDVPSYSLRNSSQISQSVRVMALCDHTPRHSKSSYRDSFFAIWTTTTTCLKWVGRQVPPCKRQDSKTCPAKAGRDKQNILQTTWHFAFAGIHH